MKNATFANCRIVNLSLECYSTVSCSASCINSIIQDITGSHFDLKNCVIKFFNTGVYAQKWVDNSLLVNCIIYGAGNSSSSFPASTTAYNCVEVNNYTSANTFKNIPNNTNKYSTCEAVFKTYTGVNIGTVEEETFELTETAKATYLGTDGKQVGIYGGMLPFDTTPSNPRITKCNVAAKSTADGKLSVDIEVKAAE